MAEDDIWQAGQPNLTMFHCTVLHNSRRCSKNGKCLCNRKLYEMKLKRCHNSCNKGCAVHCLHNLLVVYNPWCCTFVWYINMLLSSQYKTIATYGLNT